MKLTKWLLADLELPQGVHMEVKEQHAWWRVMCLTGVDYFSTLGYQPGIAFLAAGVLSPVATLVLVLVTLFAALPVYRRVAKASPHGQGSISMLERLFPEWWGKIFVLVLLGFATTDFTITMTLSAADAGAHFVSNPFAPHWAQSQMGVTLVLIALLGAVFLKGFKEAIGIAVALVALYLVLNAIVTAVAFDKLFHHPMALPAWKHALFAQRGGNPLLMIGVALLLFPKLALGLSGFETGVAVMPLVRSDKGHEQHGADAPVKEELEGNAEDVQLPGRIHNTRKLLTVAALIMSVFLILTSFVTTLLIPAQAFAEKGPANGRAMAYLAHQYMGSGFGTLYDISTILILAFAGASAMAGLLNLIPRYLPRFGMAPEWMRATRPLVLVFTTVAFAVTFLFHADVDAQGGAYATGVLVLITSAAFAVTLSQPVGWSRMAFMFIALIFVYTTIINIWERPEGLKISSFFILAMLLTSIVSRAIRSTELRITNILLDDKAQSVLNSCGCSTVRLVPRRFREESPVSLEEADRYVRSIHSIDEKQRLIFFEIERGDASEFTDTLQVGAATIGDHDVLYARSPVVANAIAAMLIHIEGVTGMVPHGYFNWKDGNPLANLLKFLFLGSGDTAPITHEVIRRAVADPSRRPVVHVS